MTEPVSDAPVTDASDSPPNSDAPRAPESPESDNFRPITNQEEFDAALRQRLARAEKAAEKKFTGRVTELEGIVHAFENEKLSVDEKKDKALADATAAIAERDTKLQTYERKEKVSSLADELGLPRKFWDRVRGDSDEDITADINDLLEALPKADAKVKQTGTVKVQSTGDPGEQEVTADSIFKNLPPHLR